MNPKARIYVSGHRGMVGSALVRRLKACGYHHLLLPPRQDLDLTCQASVRKWFEQERPDVVFLAAAHVGGIQANNTYRADFLYNNLMIACNVLHAAWNAEVSRLLFLGSSCIYPRDCPQPIDEASLLTGPLEPTNEPYAVAKIAGLKLCESYNRQYSTQYLAVMPTNLYGPNDNYDLNNSHVLPALLRKAHEAKLNGAEVLQVWGSGRPRRELMHVDDLAEACVFLMEHPSPPLELLNIGTGVDHTICELAEAVLNVVGFSGRLVFDNSKPDGTPQKLLDVSRMSHLGWRSKISLSEGLQRTYHDFCTRDEVSMCL